MLIKPVWPPEGKDKKRETLRNGEKETEMKEGTQRQNKEKQVDMERQVQRKKDRQKDDRDS